jgi:hypothetical protein
MTDLNYLQPDDAFIERIFAEVDAETAELRVMDPAQKAYAIAAVRKALSAVRNTQQSSDTRFADTFTGDDAQLIDAIEALLEMDAAGALVPHCVGGHARTLLGSAAARIEASHHAELVEALDPFARVARLNDAAGLNSPDERPCRDFFPGIWPTLGDCRRAAAVLAKCGGGDT